jgi:hypothetical protein
MRLSAATMPKIRSWMIRYDPVFRFVVFLLLTLLVAAPICVAWYLRNSW